MEVPFWLKSYILSNDIFAIEQAVAKAEKTTSGEIVPMIVRKSSTTGHVQLIIFLIFSIFYFGLNLNTQICEWFNIPEFIPDIFFFLFAYVLSVYLSSFDHICRWLTSEQDLMIQVQQRAIREFYEHQIHNTKSSTGILIFLSIMEQKAVILGDKSISEKLSPETWQNIIDTLLSGIKRKQTLIGLKKAIQMSGELLKIHFPTPSSDKNELKNHLIIID